MCWISWKNYHLYVGHILLDHNNDFKKGCCRQFLLTWFWCNPGTRWMYLWQYFILENTGISRLLCHQNCKSNKVSFKSQIQMLFPSLFSDNFPKLVLCCSSSSGLTRRQSSASSPGRPCHPSHPCSLSHQLQHEPGEPRHTHNLYLDDYQVTASLTHLWSVLCSSNITIKRWLPHSPTWSRWQNLFVRQQSQQPLDKQSEAIRMYNHKI